jgi:hypothetical protein
VKQPPIDSITERARTISGVLHAALLTLLATYCLKALLYGIGAQHVDNLSWRLMSSIALPLVSADSSPHNIVVLAIGDEYFEREFQQSSPLNRAELVKIVASVDAALIPERRPVVAIDFDVSPIAGSDPLQSRAQEQLDAALRKLSGKARVYLLCPFAQTEQLRAKQVSWAEALSKESSGRIRFALPDLHVQAGAALHYDKDGESLGVLAGKSLRSVWPGLKKQTQSAPDDSVDPVAPCRAKSGSQPSRSPTQKINFAGYGAHSFLELASATPVAEFLSMWQPLLVFIGGSYALMADEFSTATGEHLPGVAMHAAVAYSAVKPIDRLPDYLEPLLQFTVVLLVIKVGKHMAHWVFDNMQPVGRGSVGGSQLASVIRWIWDVGPDADPTREAEVWTRWLVGLAMLAAVFFILVLGFGVISIGLMLAFHYWYDFFLVALVAFGKAVSLEFRRVMERLGRSGKERPDASSAPDTPARRQISVRTVVWIGVVIRASVLLVGAVYLVAKLVPPV